MIVHLDGLVLDLPPQEIAYAVAPLFTAMASFLGPHRQPIRILDACTHPPERPAP